MRTPWYEIFFGEDYGRYDHHHTTEAEVAFLTRQLSDCRTVLDVGCGYGRHAIPLAESGVKVVGIDLSWPLLTDAKNKSGSPDLVRADMRRLPLADGSVDGLISMYSSLGYFEDESDNYDVISEFARVLEPGGKIVIETVNRDYVVRHFQPRAWYSRNGLTVLESRRFDPVASRSEVDVTVIQGASRRTYHHSIRLYTASELAMLLASAGMVVTTLFGNFEDSPYDWDQPHMILVAERV